MQVELGEVLGNQRHHAGVVGARRELGEDHVVADHKEFHAE